MPHHFSIPPQLQFTNISITNLFFLCQSHLQMRHHFSIPSQLQICSSFCPIYKSGTVCRSLLDLNYKFGLPNIAGFVPPSVPFTNPAPFFNPSSITNLFFLCQSHLQMRHRFSIPPQLQICSSFCPIYKSGTVCQSLLDLSYKFGLTNIAGFVPPSIPFTNPAPFFNPSPMTNLSFLLSHLQIHHRFSIPPQLQICSSFCPIYKSGTVCRSLLHYKFVLPNIARFVSVPFTNPAQFFNSSPITDLFFLLSQ